MLQKLSIEGYRGFEQFSMDHLGTVNLLVGENGAGKTSILEAAEILASPVVPHTLWRVLSRRDERIGGGADRRFPDVAVEHLFRHHECEIGRGFRIEGMDARGRLVMCGVEVISALRAGVEQTSLAADDEPETGSVLALRIDRGAEDAPSPVPLSREGGMSGDVVMRRAPKEAEAAEPVAFLGPSEREGVGWPAPSLAAMWDRIVLTSEESLATQALQLVEPRVERVAALSGAGSRWLGSIVVKLRDTESRLPLGSLGDGAKRLLALAVNLVGCRGGCLLVDEIDTGLHFSTMVEAWKMILGVARRLDVQVFATTHSLDCLQALGRLCEQDPDAVRGCVVHRVDRGARTTTRYSPEEILLAARGRIEVRRRGGAR